MAQQERFLTRRKVKGYLISEQLRMRDTFERINFSAVPGLLLVCDIENTIARRGDTVLGSEVLEKFRRAYEAGYRYVVLRTNKMQKLVKSSVKEGTSPYYSGTYAGDFSRMVSQLEWIFGRGNVLLRQPQKTYWPPWAAGKWPRKPWRGTFRSDVSIIQDQLIMGGKTPLSPSQILAIGDKFRFDVLRPLLMGWNVVLVNPMGEDGKGDKFAQIRRIENFTLWRLGLYRP